MEDKPFLNQVRGFTPVIDVLAQELGVMTALVYGIVWRYCQMRDGVCWAGKEAIADHVGIDPKTVRRHLLKLVDAGYLEDTTPDWTHKPHIYRDTGLAQITGLVQAKVGGTESPTSQDLGTTKGGTESPTLFREGGQKVLPGGTESPTRGDRKSYLGGTESPTKIVVRKNQEREEERDGYAANSLEYHENHKPQNPTAQEVYDNPDISDRAKALLKDLEKKMDAKHVRQGEPNGQ